MMRSRRADGVSWQRKGSTGAVGEQGSDRGKTG